MLATIMSIFAGVEDGADSETGNLLWTILVVLLIACAAVWLWHRLRRR